MNTALRLECLKIAVDNSRSGETPAQHVAAAALYEAYLVHGAPERGTSDATEQPKDSMGDVWSASDAGSEGAQRELTL